MKSFLTKKDYAKIPFIRINPKQRILTSSDGVVFEELADGSWLPIGDEHNETVRYVGTVSHNGGICFNPIYELVGEDWFFITTGKPAPPVVRVASCGGRVANPKGRTAHHAEVSTPPIVKSRLSTAEPTLEDGERYGSRALD